MDKNTIFIGFFLTALFIMSAFWHIRENARLEKELAKKTDPKTAQWLVHFAWSRTLQLLAALGCAILIFINYDKELNENKINTPQPAEALTAKSKLLNNSVAQRKKIQLPAQTPAVTAKAVQTPLSNATQVAATTNQQPVSDHTPADSATAQKRISTNETLEALYNPEKSRTDPQSTFDEIKKRYEDIVVIHLFLKKCNKVQPTDFSVISHAIAQEIAMAKAPTELQNEIMTAALGSYNEIYAKSSCDGKGIDDLTSQYNNYIKVLSENFPLN